LYKRINLKEFNFKYTNKQNLLLNKLKRKFVNFVETNLTVSKIIYFVVSVLFSILSIMFVIFLLVYLINISKLSNKFEDIPEEMSIGMAIFYDIYQFDVKETIIQKLVEAYKKKYVRNLYITVLTNGENIISDSTIYESLLKEIPKNRYSFIFKYENVFDMCKNLKLNEISKFVAFSTKNLLVETATYCNLQNRYNLGIIAYPDVDYFDFVNYTKNTIFSVKSLIFEENFK